MRLPVEPLTPVDTGITENIYDIREVAALAAAKRVAGRTLPPLVTHPRYPEAEPGGKEAHPDQAEAEKRMHEDRRNLCRRVGDQPVMLDTRTHADRRKKPRRGDEHAVSIDEEV